MRFDAPPIMWIMSEAYNPCLSANLIKDAAKAVFLFWRKSKACVSSRTTYQLLLITLNSPVMVWGIGVVQLLKNPELSS